ncbi:MAG: sulfatase-like hydrolase/transferase, partial [Pirellulaceae bacterium]
MMGRIYRSFPCPSGTLFRLAILLLPVTLFASARQFVAAEGPPNVVVILADDLGYGDLSSYGATDLRSPHIDDLVQRGMKFTN